MILFLSFTIDHYLIILLGKYAIILHLHTRVHAVPQYPFLHLHVFVVAEHSAIVIPPALQSAAAVQAMPMTEKKTKFVSTAFGFVLN